MSEIILEVWGDFALFSQPTAKVERMTYPFITPSAARGLLSSIYSKPAEFYWQVNRIEVLRPIQYIGFKRNEVQFKTMHKPIVIDDKQRTQRQSIALKDVRYRIAASIVRRAAFQGTTKQLYGQALRRIRSGKCFLQPCFGLREFAAYFEEYDPAVHTDRPIQDSMDIGFMVYDIFDLHDYSVSKKKSSPKTAKFQLSLFHAVMEHGVIEVPPYDSPAVLKGGDLC